MNVLDRHLFKSVLITCVGAVGLFAFVLMLGNAMRDLLGYVLAGQLAYGTFVRLVILLVPFVVSYALPMGVLTGVLLTLGRLSADSEITAMRAAGLSLPRIARPVILLAMLGMIAGLYINYEAMPWARVEYHRELAEAVRSNPLSFITPRTFIRDFPGFIIYVGEKNGAEVRDCWVWELDNRRRVQHFVHAASGHADYDEENNTLVLTLSHFQFEDRDPKAPEEFFGKDVLVGRAESSGRQIFSLEKIFGRQGFHRKTQWMRFGQLLAEHEQLVELRVPLDQAKQHARDVMKVQMIISDKANTALAVLSFALIGVPLGIRVSRRETSANLGVAVLLALGYYFLVVMVGWLDRHPEYRPDLLLWLPNLVLIGLGAWLFNRIDRR
ncbi:MAG: LptF/LptG family permease [Verrucomicrobiota bacterium]|nr:LptF/LptG family permease [Verrucomicrobiota bacterium]